MLIINVPYFSTSYNEFKLLILINKRKMIR